MSAAALQAFLERHRAQAALTLQLDEELGTRHGMDWADFLLLDCIDTAGGTLPMGLLARRCGRRPSQLLRQVLPLEKLGWIARTTGSDGARAVALRASARRLLNEARETAAVVCEGAAS
ncbi:AsnC family transcriptional regulator [Ramlibacter sp. AN1015]|uniref:AsnC family transcriptional regulator n=1 Tax=Ramlibacter sp. AN1015 TaxID=3133428 RepID=UPI0030C4DCD3